MGTSLLTKIEYMLSVYLMTAFALSATSAVAIEQRRYSRSHSDGLVSVSVHPKLVEMKKGESLSIKCRTNYIKGETSALHIPFITFYRRLNGHTVMPLSSSSYGVNIQAVPASYKKMNTRFLKSVKLLTLEPEFYDILDYGRNTFYCKGMSLDGSSNAQFFVVWKS